jgi:ABC-type sulfate transport system permease component
MTTRFPKSKVGWVCVGFYLAVAAFLINQAFSCSDWLCDLVEFPVTIPFGLLYLEVLRLLAPNFVFGSLTYAPFRNWFFIIPTLIGNSIIFYWLGVRIAKLFSKLSKRSSA